MSRPHPFNTQTSITQSHTTHWNTRMCANSPQQSCIVTPCRFKRKSPISPTRPKINLCQATPSHAGGAAAAAAARAVLMNTPPLHSSHLLLLPPPPLLLHSSHLHLLLLPLRVTQWALP